MFMVIGVVNVHLFRTDLNNSLPLGSYLGKITGRYILFLSPKHLFFQCRNEKNLRELGEQSLVCTSHSLFLIRDVQRKQCPTHTNKTC